MHGTGSINIEMQTVKSRHGGPHVVIGASTSPHVKPPSSSASPLQQGSGGSGNKSFRYVVIIAALFGLTLFLFHLGGHSATPLEQDGGSNSATTPSGEDTTSSSSSSHGATDGIVPVTGDCGQIPVHDPHDQQRQQRQNGGGGGVRSDSIGYYAQAKAANCRNCRSWPSFLPFRSRFHCRHMQEHLAQIPPYDILAMSKRDTKRVLARNTAEKKEAARRKNAMKDRRPSAPFVTGDGFRAITEFIFDETTVPTWDALDLKNQLKQRVHYGRLNCPALFVNDLMMNAGYQNHHGKNNGNNNNNNNYNAAKEQGGGEGEGSVDPTRLELRPKFVERPNWFMQRDYRHAPIAGTRESRTLYWETVTKTMATLTEDVILENHNGVLKFLRFECATYGSTIFVQTHLLEKFIDEVLPIFELRVEQMRQCEANLSAMINNGVGRSSVKTDLDWAEKIRRMPCHSSVRHSDHSRFRESAQPEFILVTHNSDYSSPWDSSNTRGIKSDPATAKFEKQIARLIASPLLLRWFGQNMVLTPQRQARILKEAEASLRQHLHAEKFRSDVIEEWKALEKKLVAEKKARDDAKQQQQRHPTTEVTDDGQITLDPDFDGVAAAERELQRRRKIHGANYSWSQHDRQRWIFEEYQKEIHDVDLLAQKDPLHGARLIIAKKHPDVDVDKLLDVYEKMMKNKKQQQQQQPGDDNKKSNNADINDQSRSKNMMVEAKLVPIPIGLENRYNKFGAFVDKEYSAAAGCYNPDVFLFDGGLLPDQVDFWDRQNRELAVKFEEVLGAIPRETSRPFVSFSVKTNKREREEAVKAVELNFPATSGGAVVDVLDGCVKHMTAQFAAMDASIEQLRNAQQGAAAERARKKREVEGGGGGGGGADADEEDNNNSPDHKKNRAPGAGGVSSPSSSASESAEKNQKLLRGYLAKLKCHAFTLAPHGHGVDTHRYWEALYAGSIPISAASAADDQLLHFLPGLTLDGRRSSSSDSSSSFSSSEYSAHYVSGTYRDQLKPKVLQEYWCKSAKGNNIAGRMRWYDLVEPKKWQYYNARDALARPRGIFMNMSMWIDSGNSGGKSNNNNKKRPYASYPAPFVPEYLDMSFWAQLISRAVHPFREMPW